MRQVKGRKNKEEEANPLLYEGRGRTCDLGLLYTTVYETKLLIGVPMYLNEPFLNLLYRHLTFNITLYGWV